jgi:hypothetical protein
MASVLKTMAKKPAEMLCQNLSIRANYSILWHLFRSVVSALCSTELSLRVIPLLTYRSGNEADVANWPRDSDIEVCDDIIANLEIARFSQFG